MTSFRTGFALTAFEIMRFLRQKYEITMFKAIVHTQLKKSYYQFINKMLARKYSETLTTSQKTRERLLYLTLDSEQHGVVV